MSGISKEDYLRLLKELNQEDDSDELNTYSEYEDGWIPAVSQAKIDLIEKLTRANQQKTLDIFNYKKNKIKDALYESMNFKIGRYLLKINKYNGVPAETDANLSMNISFFEMKSTTPISGAPCKMQYRANFHKDSRFKGKPWLGMFSKFGTADNVSADTLVDIIKWLQVIQKIGVFL